MTSFGKKKFSDMLSLVKCEKVENLNSKIIKKKTYLGSKNNESR